MTGMTGGPPLPRALLTSVCRFPEPLNRVR